MENVNSTGFGYVIAILIMALGAGLFIAGRDDGLLLVIGIFCAWSAWAHGSTIENDNVVDRIVAERKFKHRGRYYEVEDVSDGLKGSPDD